jgi:glutathione S-transferase
VVSRDSHEAKLYVILGSHACRTGILLLEHKGIPFDLVTIPTGTQRVLRPKGTVPKLVIDGEHVQGNRDIARHLDRVQPEPPLFPADAGLRREVEEAERWGDEVFQMVARRIGLAASLHGLDRMHECGRAGRLGPILYRRDRSRYIGTRLIGRFVFDVNPRTEPGLLAELPGQLDRIDGWIEAGVLNGEELNAADYMIASSLALVLYRRDLRPAIESRPAGALAERVLPEPAGARVHAQV